MTGKARIARSGTEWELHVPPEELPDYARHRYPMRLPTWAEAVHQFKAECARWRFRQLPPADRAAAAVVIAAAVAGADAARGDEWES